MFQSTALRKFAWAALLALICIPAAVARLDAQLGLPSGRAVLGTDSDDVATGVALTADGKVLATGVVGYPSQPLPLTTAAYQAPNAEFGGAFLMKLDKGALELLSIVAANARGESIALDAWGNIVIAGVTTDAAFAVTPGAFNGGASSQPRAFIMKLTPDATSVIYAAVLGPIVINPDVGATSNRQIAGPSLRLAIDATGSAIVAGTAASGFAATPGAADTTFAGGSEAFVAKLSADGSALLYSTFLGGAAGDEAHGLAVDAAGNAIVSGTTASPDFPTTTILHAGAVSSAFVARVSADGHAIDFSTRVSGASGASGRGVALGPGGDIYLSGITRSTDFPATAAGFNLPWGVPRSEGFVMRLTPDATTIVYSTSLADPDHLRTGSLEIEQGSHMPISIAVLPDGRAVVVGTSGAGSNVMANRATSFSGEIAADGASFTAALNARPTDNGSASYDVTANAAGDRASAMTTTTWFDVSLVSPTYGKDKEAIYPDPYWEGPNGGMPADAIVDWRLAARAPGDNTTVGTGVTVAASDNSASVAFGSVTAPGTTTVTPADPATLNLTMPGGFALSGTVQAIEIHTTATVSGIQVCMNGAALSDAEFANASILHGVNGAWQVEPTTRDAATRTLCATVASLSPFAVGIHVDTTAPTITCAPAPTGWTTGPVAIACSAADQGGLAAGGDASFTLTASLPDGMESASAPTNTRPVCDTSGNCATAGPVDVRIDRRPPSIQLASPANVRYTLNQNVLASYTCADGGSGVASCAGTAASGARIATASIGQNTFAVNAADTAGNLAATSVLYTVGYDVKILLAPSVVKGNGSATIAVQLVDAAGANVSSAGIAVSAVGLKQLSTGTMIAPASWMPSTGAAFVFGVSGSTSGYGYAIATKALSSGAYELQFAAAGDPRIRTVTFNVR